MFPAHYWRYQRQQQKYLGLGGQILHITKTESSGWHAIIKLAQETITAPLVVSTKAPQVGAKVKGVLRILQTDGAAGLIQYGIKFQLLEEVI